MYHIVKNINSTSSCTGGSTWIDFEPIIFSIYINGLPLSIQNSETGMYADDTTADQAVTSVKVYNSHHKKVLTMQIFGSALTG